MPKPVYLWPGLPQLWLRGAWSGLALAVGFTGLLNIMLAASLVWTEWLAPALLAGGWLAVVGLWVAAAWVSLVVEQPGRHTDDGGDPAWLIEAQEQYLKGNWFEAETLLNRRLRRRRRDIDARLMLATLKRHTGRLDEALGQLDLLEQEEDAEKWRQEIDRERALIERDMTEDDESTTDDAHTRSSESNS